MRVGLIQALGLMSAFPKTYLTFKLGLCALVGVTVFMALPPYRLWTLGTLPLVTLAAFSMPNRHNHYLLFGAYILLGICGWAVGQFFWRVDELSSSGLKIVFLLILVASVTAVRVLLHKSDEA